MSKGNYSESENKQAPGSPATPKAGSPATPKAAPAPVPPPPPPAPSVDSVLAKDSSCDAPAAGSDGGMSAALASIASGGPKLKHVTREERKRPPATSVVPGDSGKQAKVLEDKESKETVAKGEPVLKLEDKKWTVRFQENRQDKPVVIDITAFQQSVSIANCNKAVIQVKGKCTSIAIMNSTAVGLIFDDVVASVEVVRSKKVQLQVNGTVPQIALDNSGSIDVFVQTAAGKNMEIVTSLCEGVNVNFPGETADADPVEYAIPMQFISALKNGKLHTAPSSHV
jgi:adenylyl cyclase-associated protein